ncbi:MAG TPA: aspartyl protease family protein [Pirellulales bacterium]|nr:aspartyl protease family protein [Pirellulales bacterium]
MLLAAAAALIARCGYASEEPGSRVLKFSVASGGDAPLLPVRFDGRDYLFIFDTGCTGTLFDECFRDKLGEALWTARTRTPLGEISTPYFRAPRASIAGRALSGVSVVDCADLSLMRSVSGHAIYGCLGMDYLQSQQVRIDFDRGELAFLDSVPDDAGKRIPLYFSSEHGGIVAEVDIGGARELFAIDTGLVGVGHLETRLLERLVRAGDATPFKNGEAVSVGSREFVAQPRARLDVVDLEGFRHRGLVFSGATRSALGTRYLARYVVTFDFPSMIMYLKPGRMYDEPSRHDLSGMGVWRPNGETTVDVEAGSAAHRAGIRTGDVIDKVDGRAASSMPIFQIHKLLATPGRRRLGVTRGKERFDVTLVLEETSGAERLRVAEQQKKDQ